MVARTPYWACEILPIVQHIIFILICEIFPIDSSKLVDGLPVCSSIVRAIQSRSRDGQHHIRICRYTEYLMEVTAEEWLKSINILSPGDACIIRSENTDGIIGRCE